MADRSIPRFPGAKNVIVIGGGIAGSSIMRALAAKGVGVTLLEKAQQLCAGATWHAAGLVTRFGGSPKIKKIHVRALREMIDLHESHDVRARAPSRHIIQPARQTSCAALSHSPSHRLGCTARARSGCLRRATPIVSRRPSSTWRWPRSMTTPGCRRL